jgi:hypothetical protein
MLKHCAANRKRLLSALPNVSPYYNFNVVYTTLKFLALQEAPYIYIYVYIHDIRQAVNTVATMF